MGTVAVNAPRTPVTKGSSGLAIATVPNVCKMPGPPAPFVPTPLPNIGKSGDSPKKYSKKVKFDGHTIAIKGASFGSMGDAASKGTGGGIVSSNTHGPTKFVGPGAMNVKVEGKNVQLLGDPMLNNGGPSGSPPNAATLAGVVQAPLVLIGALGKTRAETLCRDVCEEYHNGRRGDGVVDRHTSGGDSWNLNAPKPPHDLLPEATFSIPSKGGSFAPTLSKARTTYPNGPLAPTRIPAAMGRNRPGTSVRWDFTLVRDATKTCEQSNVAAFIELKGDNEDFTKNQKKARRRLRTSKKPRPDLIVLRPKDCGCPEDQPWP